MPDLILHHFAASPFSEKVRLALGYKQLAWTSVTVPNILPKPDVVALTGGYRRTPFLQIGADVYCDTALICDVLERLRPAPSLYPEPIQSLSRIVAQWADSSVFWAVVTYNRGASGELPAAVFADRKAMGFDVEWLCPADATAAYKTYLRRLSNMLAQQPFLLGTAPSIADFSAYQALWLAHGRGPTPVPLPIDAPALVSWMQRMQAIGHGQSVPMTATEAIAVAAGSKPAPAGKNLLADDGLQDEHGIALGSRVTIAAESFGLESTEGELIAATPSHYSLRRTDDRAGSIHVHFPRVGYVLKRS